MNVVCPNMMRSATIAADKRKDGDKKAHRQDEERIEQPEVSTCTVSFRHRGTSSSSQDMTALIATRCKIASRYALLDPNVVRQEKMQYILIQLQESILEGVGLSMSTSDKRLLHPKKRQKPKDPFTLRQEIEEIFAKHVASPQQALEVSRLVSDLVSETHRVGVSKSTSSMKRNQGNPRRIQRKSPETIIIMDSSDSDDNDDIVPTSTESANNRESTSNSSSTPELSTDTRRQCLKEIATRLVVIEGEKMDKKSLLKEWKALQSLKEISESNSLWDRSDWRYLCNRQAALRRVEQCIQSCWGGNEAAYVSSPLPSWPNVCQRYVCTCSGTAKKNHSPEAVKNSPAVTQAETNVAKADSGDASFNAGKKSRHFFHSIQNRLRQIESQKTDKAVILKDWRELRNLMGTPSAKSFFDETEWRYMANRRAPLRHVEACIQKCWNGSEAGFLASPKANWPSICRRYDCTCSTGSDKTPPLTRACPMRQDQTPNAIFCETTAEKARRRRRPPPPPVRVDSLHTAPVQQSSLETAPLPDIPPATPSSHSLLVPETEIPGAQATEGSHKKQKREEKPVEASCDGKQIFP